MGTSPDYGFEEKALQQGYLRIVGIDEAGRGALCGPVVAAAVWLDPERIPAGLNDSKALTARQRSLLFDRIVAVADVGVGTADVDEIEALNILRASHLAMIRAIESLRYRPDFALVDGHLLPRRLPVRGEAVVKGDARVLSIAAASVVAKVARDRSMVDLAQQFPGYGWERNMGYPTTDHRAALQILGATPHHRRSFGPVHNILYQEKTLSR
jgi:ribonuclease HII